MTKTRQTKTGSEWRWRLIGDDGGSLTLEVTEHHDEDADGQVTTYRYVHCYNDALQAAEDISLLRAHGPEYAMSWDGNLLDEMTEPYESPSRYAGGWGVLDAIDEEAGDDLTSYHGGDIGEQYRAASKRGSR